MRRLLALGLMSLPLACPAAGDYLGILRVPQSGLNPTGIYSFTSGPTHPTALAPEGYRMKLGYKATRYLSVEGEFSDFTRPADLFAHPATLSSAFRSTGFGLDTVATLPLWRFSFYGRMGAYHGDRTGFNSYSTTLLGGDNAARNTRWRYGLGVRYDFTKALGIRAELERHSLGLGSPFAGDVDADQVTVGLSWRF